MVKSQHYRIIVMLAALILAGFSQALTIGTQLGATIWTAASLNLCAAFLQTTNLVLINRYSGTVMILLSIVIGGLNWFLVPAHSIQRLCRNLLFVLPFSYLIQFDFWLCQPFFTGVQQLPAALNVCVRIVINIIGIIGIAISISLYQRANILLHPYDDLAFIIRFRFCHGRMAWAQLISFAVPALIVGLTTMFNSGNSLGIGLGTILTFCFQGILVQYFDRHLLPTFKHQNLLVIQ